jgi:hypothetical protein
MKQVVSDKIRRKCEAITGRAYRICYANGAREHFWAQCWFGDGERLRDCDDVNYKTGEWRISIREGQYA